MRRKKGSFGPLLSIERFQVVDHASALELGECAGGLVDDGLDPMRPELVNHIEGRVLPKVVRPVFHGQAERAEDLRLHCQDLVDD